MAFLLRNSAISSTLRYHPQKAELLAEDPALKRFKSHKKSVQTLKRVGDVLTIAVVVGCCYEIYVRAVMREEARKRAT